MNLRVQLQKFRHGGPHPLRRTLRLKRIELSSKFSEELPVWILLPET